MNYETIGLLSEELDRLASNEFHDVEFVRMIRIKALMPDLLTAVTGVKYPYGLPIASAMGLINENVHLYWDRNSKAEPVEGQSL